MPKQGDTASVYKKGNQIKKHQLGGKYNQSYYNQKADYINNPFNLERLSNRIKELGTMIKLPVTAGLMTGAGAITGLPLMAGYGTSASLLGGALTGSAAATTGLLINSLTNKNSKSNYIPINPSGKNTDADKALNRV